MQTTRYITIHSDGSCSYGMVVEANARIVVDFLELTFSTISPDFQPGEQIGILPRQMTDWKPLDKTMKGQGPRYIVDADTCGDGAMQLWLTGDLSNQDEVTQIDMIDEEFCKVCVDLETGKYYQNNVWNEIKQRA